MSHDCLHSSVWAGSFTGTITILMNFAVYTNSTFKIQTHLFLYPSILAQTSAQCVTRIRLAIQFLRFKSFCFTRQEKVTTNKFPFSVFWNISLCTWVNFYPSCILNNKYATICTNQLVYFKYIRWMNLSTSDVRVGATNSRKTSEQ